MTTQSAGSASPEARPYTIRVDVPNLTLTSIGYSVFTKPYIDAGLTAAELETLAGRRLSNGRTVREYLQFLTFLGAMTLLISVSSLESSRDMPSAAGWLTAGVILLVTGLIAGFQLRGEEKRQEAATAGLILNGALLPIPDDNAVKRDLDRIEAALRILHSRGITENDVRARIAAWKVINQDNNRPAAKHIAIAESKAHDAASQTIREKCEHQTTLWNADVAAAELAIMELVTATGASLRKNA